MSRIALALTKLFERHRVLFWYDTKRELRGDFETLELPEVEKVEIRNNEFGLKHRILRIQPEQKFLLYREGEQPADPDNWLLDIQLAHDVFRTDQVGIWLSELELSLDFTAVVEEHAEFYRVAKRREALKALLKPDDSVGRIRLKMLAICAGCPTDARIDAIAEQLLAEAADGRDEKAKLISRCNLDAFHWEHMTRFYGYRSDNPSITDFVIELFKSCYVLGTQGDALLTPDALVFLKRWKDSRSFEKCFEWHSDECAKVLGIEEDLETRDFRTLIELDYFRLIDRKIISDLVRAVGNRTESGGDVALWVRQRRQSHWYGEFRHSYEAIDYAAKFLHAMDEATLSMESLQDGVERYRTSWYLLDQLYRKFVYHERMAGQASLMESLSEQIENLYSNNFLLKLNDRWQTFVDETPMWGPTPMRLQRTFFKQWVQPFLKKDNKVCVIISDAMRYEVGDELIGLIRQEDRYNAEMDSALSMLPSYTQLGMAALLPNKELSLADNDSGSVLVDGLSSQGLANRVKILEASATKRATALKADEFMGMNKEECRTLLRDHDVIYLYHNRIDDTGDKRESEERVFVAVEETLQELIRLIKKLTGANANNLLVTSDHGFIYQNRALEESDFSGSDAEGDEILFRDRRFVLGKGLKATSGFRKFSSAQLGLSGDMEVLIPKSINRLRLKGSGSRYVHGGASLQEVVLPVLKINKKRQSDVTAVEVDILRGTSSTISSGQVAVAFYQAQPVTDKVQSRILRAGIYTQAGDLISDSHELVFDLASENPRERELQVRFVLTRKADDANEQEVILKLEEKHAGTTHYKEYKSLRYLVRRSFTSDFDF